MMKISSVHNYTNHFFLDSLVEQQIWSGGTLLGTEFFFELLSCDDRDAVIVAL
jgi:hypothetical protein